MKTKTPDAAPNASQVWKQMEDSLVPGSLVLLDPLSIPISCATPPRRKIPSLHSVAPPASPPPRPLTARALPLLHWAHCAWFNAIVTATSSKCSSPNSSPQPSFRPLPYSSPTPSFSTLGPPAPPHLTASLSANQGPPHPSIPHRPSLLLPLTQPEVPHHVLPPPSPNSYRNLVSSCVQCNSQKGARPVASPLRIVPETGSLA